MDRTWSRLINWDKIETDKVVLRQCEWWIGAALTVIFDGYYVDKRVVQGIAPGLCVQAMRHCERRQFAGVVWYTTTTTVNK